jgi:hypothetical protein
MAFLRRGLVTHRQDRIPSIHTAVRHAPAVEDRAYHLGELREVKKVLSHRDGTNKFFVLLSCGHKTASFSVYQAFCKECKTAKLSEVNGNILRIA